MMAEADIQGILRCLRCLRCLKCLRCLRCFGCLGCSSASGASGASGMFCLLPSLLRYHSPWPGRLSMVMRRRAFLLLPILVLLAAIANSRAGAQMPDAVTVDALMAAPFP